MSEVITARWRSGRPAVFWSVARNVGKLERRLFWISLVDPEFLITNSMSTPRVGTNGVPSAPVPPIPAVPDPPILPRPPVLPPSCERGRVLQPTKKATATAPVARRAHDAHIIRSLSVPDRARSGRRKCVRKGHGDVSFLVPGRRGSGAGLRVDGVRGPTAGPGAGRRCEGRAGAGPQARRPEPIH